eukprot:27022-Eustigmatos_ZCMA.PRE.1
MAVIVAVLDAKPPNNPASGKPMRSPNHRAAKWPVLPVSMISSTTSQRVCGFQAFNGPMARSGTAGQISNAATARINKSASSR